MGKTKVLYTQQHSRCDGEEEKKRQKRLYKEWHNNEHDKPIIKLRKLNHK